MNTEKTIFVAEDESDLSSAIQASLASAGYKVVAVKDGEEALAQYKEVKPDLMLLDLNMPKVGGLEVLKQVRSDEDFASLPVTILTAQDDINTVSDVAVIGGMNTDFLPKADRSLEQIVEHVTQRLS